MTGSSGMASELREAPDAVRRQETSRDAVNDLVAVYNAARAKGLKPDPSWLKPNPQF